MDVLFCGFIPVFLIIGMPLIMAFNRLSSLEFRIRSLESRLLEEEKKPNQSPTHKCPERGVTPDYRYGPTETGAY